MRHQTPRRTAGSDGGTPTIVVTTRADVGRQHPDEDGAALHWPIPRTHGEATATDGDECIVVRASLATLRQVGEAAGGPPTDAEYLAALIGRAAPAADGAPSLDGGQS